MSVASSPVEEPGTRHASPPRIRQLNCCSTIWSAASRISLPREEQSWHRRPWSAWIIKVMPPAHLCRLKAPSPPRLSLRGPRKSARPCGDSGTTSTRPRNRAPKPSHFFSYARSLVSRSSNGHEKELALTGGWVPRTIYSRVRHGWKSRVSSVAAAGESTVESRPASGKLGNRVTWLSRHMWSSWSSGRRKPR